MWGLESAALGSASGAARGPVGLACRGCVGLSGSCIMQISFLMVLLWEGLHLKVLIMYFGPYSYTMTKSSAILFILLFSLLFKLEEMVRVQCSALRRLKLRHREAGDTCMRNISREGVQLCG